MIFTTIFLVISSVLLTVVWFMRRQYSFWKNLNIPYVEPEYLFGNMRGVGRKEALRTRLTRYYNKYKNETPLIGIYFFLKPIALIMDQELIKNIMIKEGNIFNDRGVYYNEKDDPLSAHLFAIHGTKWRLLRSKLTPTFTSGKMKFMFPILVEITERLEKKLWSETENKEDMEIKDLLARYTTDIIGSCAFGIECNTLNDRNTDFRQMGLRIFDESKFNFTTALLLMTINDLALKLRVKRLHSDVAKFFTDVVVQTIDYRTKNNIRRNDFLDILLELQKSSQSSDNPLTLNEILAQAFVFFAAGFETSSTLLTFCLYELAINKDIQEKTRQHIEEVLTRHNGELTYEAMMEMKYLDQVLNETLRLYSPVTTLFRIADADYKVPNTEFILKKGTMCAIPSDSIHKDSEFYPNPEEFNPENFNETNRRERSATTFMPFGEGPRICIGLRFGMMQARLGLVGALRKFQYSISSKMEFPVNISKNHFIITPIGGMWLKVNRLDKNCE